MSEFDDNLDQERWRKAPVRSAVRTDWPTIQAARERGEPLNAIFRALKRMGRNVGRGPSSFRAAIKHWDAVDKAASQPGLGDIRASSDF